MANISDLKTGQGNVNVEGVIKELGETRNISKYGRELKVANAMLEDESGSIKLTLWNDDVARFKEGDKVKVLNGYVSEFQGELQLTSGKFGRMEKVTSEVRSVEENSSEVKEEIEKETASPESKKRKASVSKKEIKKKNEESLDVYNEDSGNEEALEEESSQNEEEF